MSDLPERRVYLGGEPGAQVAGWEFYREPLAVRCPLKIEDSSVSILYVHYLNSLDWTSSLTVMQDWHRVLRPGGALLIAAVDAAAVGRMLNQEPNFDEQIMLLRLLSNYRSHWSAAVLGNFLEITGFKNVRKAENFGFFNDTSALALRGGSLALCVLADKITP